MLSTCPNCKKQIEHEDFLFEVACDCGSRFNPFMGLSEAPPLDGVEATPAAPAWQEPAALAIEVELEAEPAALPEATPQPEKNFEESRAAFDEIQAYAEGKPLPPAPAKAAAPRPAGSSGDAVLTAGDGLPGYRIDAYLAPVSAVSLLNAADANPLRPGFDALWAQATASGANGVVAMRWVLSPDGSRVILSGTPVRCTKDGN